MMSAVATLRYRPHNARMRVLHWFLTAINRATSALGALLYGTPVYGVETSAVWERCLFLAMVTLLIVWGLFAAW
jgi:hypothetical protein